MIHEWEDDVKRVDVKPVNIWPVRYGGGFVKLYHSEEVAVLYYHDPTAGRLLFYLMLVMDKNNRCLCHGKELAEVIGRHVKTVYRKLKRLQELRFIYLTKKGNMLVANINPAIFNRGNKIVVHNFPEEWQVVTVAELEDYFCQLKEDYQNRRSQVHE